MIGMAGKQAGRAEQLLEQHRPGEQVRPSGLAEGEQQVGLLALAFGKATWPHLLARAMLLEQLFRATSLLAGHPYHRGG